MTARHRAEREQVLDWAREQGCEIRVSKKTSQFGVYFEDRRVGTVPQIASCPHAWKNAKSLIRRNIAQIKDTKQQRAATSGNSVTAERYDDSSS